MQSNWPLYLLVFVVGAIAVLGLQEGGRHNRQEGHPQLIKRVNELESQLELSTGKRYTSEDAAQDQKQLSEMQGRILQELSNVKSQTLSVAQRQAAFEQETERLKQRYVCITQVPQTAAWLDWCDVRATQGYIFLREDGSRAPLPEYGRPE